MAYICSYIAYILEDHIETAGLKWLLGGRGVAQSTADRTAEIVGHYTGKVLGVACIEQSLEIDGL